MTLGLYRTSKVCRKHVWSPWYIHLDLLQGVIVERRGNHSYKESLPVTSSRVAWIIEAELCTEDWGNKVRQESKYSIMYLGSGWSYMAREASLVHDLTLGYKWPVSFWRCLSTKREEKLHSPITLSKDLGDKNTDVLLKRTWGEDSS